MKQKNLLWRTKSYQSLDRQTGIDITTTHSLQFDLKTIETATDKFSESNKIGQGGFGEVFKGVLPDGTEVAVKRLIFGMDQTQAETSRIVGTYGYMSPEYAMKGHFSVKSDVYSFGVLVLEIIAGKRNNGLDRDGNARNLVTYVWRLWREGSPLELVDPSVGENYDSNEVTRCIHIALLCVQEDPADRPTLASIILMLTSNTITLPVPRQPGFFFQSRLDDFEGLEPSQSTGRSMPYSVNDVSITDLEPR
ncbi:unnamed protein product [Arabidopsis arenosa]|uniref:Protein kinase domain-containing protein n=1 Tax=Arabidopsis arenosa TaxID=38785 RepID=A0A8S2AST0_ARAAE|nr:unnamed protein product [Arabidopsis arenosa]